MSRHPDVVPTARRRQRLAGVAAALAFIGTASPAAGSREYLRAGQLRPELEHLAGRSGGLVSLSELCPSCDGEPIPVVTIGDADPARPAVLVVAGLDGRHLLGTELAVDLVRAVVAAPDSSRARFAERSLYIVPRLSEEGARSAWEESPRRVRATVPRPSDRDRDGLRDEDRADDLDGNGWITLVRVEDPDGDWIVGPNTPDLLRRARPEAGEAGQWRLLLEGRDDDEDERWNEEEDGGVLLGAAFPIHYKWFAPGRGAVPLAEPVTRALADFLIVHPGIGAVLVYGFEDNLLTPPPEAKTSDPDPRVRGEGRPIDLPNKADLPYVLEIGKRYRASLGIGEKGRAGFAGFGVALEAEDSFPVPGPEEAAAGGFASYVYYARGVLALATPGWTPALQKTLLDARAKAEHPERDEGAPAEPAGAAPPDSAAHPAPPDSSAGVPKQPEAESALAEEAAFLEWLRSVDPGSWLGWREIEHPDFPGQRAFAGGYHPLARINPPAALLDSLAEPHVRLALRLVDGLPRVQLREAELKALGNGLHELRFVIENSGYLPDVLAQGGLTKEVRGTRFEITLPQGAEVIGEAARGSVDRIPGAGGAVTVRRMMELGAEDRITIRVLSEFGGVDERTISPGAPWRREQ